VQPFHLSLFDFFILTLTIFLIQTILKYKILIIYLKYYKRYLSLMVMIMADQNDSYL
jgi:hypothetical protein